jgi:hypothetical protein
LDGSQFVKNHFELAREHAPLLANRLGRLIGSTLFPHTHGHAASNNSWPVVFSHNPRQNSSPFR